MWLIIEVTLWDDVLMVWDTSFDFTHIFYPWYTAAGWTLAARYFYLKNELPLRHRWWTQTPWQISFQSKIARSLPHTGIQMVCIMTSSHTCCLWKMSFFSPFADSCSLRSCDRLFPITILCCTTLSGLWWYEFQSSLIDPSRNQW